VTPGLAHGAGRALLRTARAARCRALGDSRFHAVLIGRRPTNDPLCLITAKARHDDAAGSLERSREQLEELLRTLDQQRGEITDELQRVQGALAALTPSARRRATGRDASAAAGATPSMS
jgi:hypothetical protein